MSTLLFVLITLSLLYGLVAYSIVVYNERIKFKAQNSGSTSRPTLITEIPFKKSLLKYLIIVWFGFLFSFYISNNCVYYVDGQEVAVKIGLNGVQKDAVNSGIHFKLPWERIRKLDKTVWVYTFARKSTDGQRTDADEIWASTKDVIKVGMDVSAAWSIDDTKAPEIYSLVSSTNVEDTTTNFGSKYKWIEENLIRPLVVSNITNVTALYTPMEVISTKRQQIQDEVFKRVKLDLTKYNLILKSVDFRQVYYNKDYEASVVAIQTAEKEIERQVQITAQKKELLVQAEIDKQTKIKNAEGDAESMRVRGEAISANPKIVNLEFLKVWNGEYPHTLIMNGKPESLILNTDK